MIDGNITRFNKRLAVYPGDSARVTWNGTVFHVAYEGSDRAIAVGAYQSWRDGRWHLLLESMMEWPLREFFPLREIDLVDHGPPPCDVVTP